MGQKRIEFKKVFGFEPPFDRVLLLCGRTWIIDVIEFDRKLEQYTPGYDKDECTYQGKPDYSCNMVVEEVYGKEAVEIVKQMISC
jgi:hypothetical protein